MGTSNSYKRLYVVFSVLMLLACGGGGESSAPAPAPNIYLAQSTIDFAGVVLVNTSDRTFVIKNTGNADLRIGRILPLNLPFNIATDTCSLATLTPSQTCSLGIRFSPTSQGPSSATLSIPSNDPDSSTVNISLNGEGYGLNVWINKVNSASCPSISVDVTVTDPASGSLLNLTTDKFKLYQNGQQQNITAIAIENPSPVSLVLTLDWSGSTINIISDVQAAAKSFINQLKDGDWAAICKFSGDIGFDPPGPSPLFRAGDDTGKSLLNAYIDLDFASNNTVLYDAVFQSIDRAAQGSTDKRAVIVLSDGVDTHSVKTLDQVIANATQKGIPVFTIFFIDPNYSQTGNTQIMQRLARETGGQYYNSDTADLAAIFQQISNTLSNKYTLNYSASPSTCSGTISVRAESGTSYGQDTISFP